MNTVEELRYLAKRASDLENQGHLTRLSERDTERHLIEPFIEALGYNLLDLNEVETQPSTPFATINVKCDYAIKKDGARIMLIEAKKPSFPLGEANQLSDYFGRESEVWLGIFTNGAEYRFYSGDPDGVKKMDPQPFLVLDLLEFDEEIAETVSTFAKDRFDPNEVRELAKERKFQQKYETAIRDALREELEEPSEKLFQLLINKVGAEDEDLERMKPLVKKVANQILKLPPPSSGDTSPASPAVFSPTTERDCFLTEGKYGVNAKGYYNPHDNKLVVLKGSKASKTDQSSLLYMPQVGKLREKFRQSGVWKDNGETYVFTQDYAFNSPSSASSVCLGRNSNGLIDWKDKNGLPIRELRKRL